MGQLKIGFVLYFPDTPVYVYGPLCFKRGAEIVHIGFHENVTFYVRIVDIWVQNCRFHHIWCAE